MKTPEEIKRNLLHCAQGDGCLGCQYDQHDVPLCCKRMAKDAHGYIDQLEERIALMMIQMRGDCGCCKHCWESLRCSDCIMRSENGTVYHPLWEYEGLPEIETEEHDGNQTV